MVIMPAFLFRFACLFLASGLATSFAGFLMPCPDCEGVISRRASICPHCGCPSEAIVVAAEKFEKENAAPALLPVARYRTIREEGLALAITDGTFAYLLLDPASLGDSAGLSFETLNPKPQPISYESLEIAGEGAWARFKTSATNLHFMSYADKTDDPGRGLVVDGVNVSLADDNLSAGDLVAYVDANTNIISFVRIVDEVEIRVDPGRLSWEAISPSNFRSIVKAASSE